MRLEACGRPSFETPAFGGLLRMRAERQKNGGLAARRFALKESAGSPPIAQDALRAFARG